MFLKDYIIRLLKHSYRIVFRKHFLNPECDCDRQSSNDRVYNLLASGKPCMISRFGTTEINCVNNYLCVHRKRSFVKKCWDYVTDYTHTPWWNEDHFRYMNLWSGIFPEGIDTAERFSERYLNDIPEIDLLVSHQYYEKFMPLRSGISKIQLEMLYPFFVEQPWTRFLRGKRVLVIHPFVETIKQQYEKRHLLFENPEILPDFELITFKSVQTIAGNKSQFKDWFEALTWMEAEIDSINFDVALIGCGAYGLPLAAHVKRIGKPAIHMAGGLQLLFGIKGKRWTEEHLGTFEYRPGIVLSWDYRSLFNDNWCFPLDIDTPKDAVIVEGGCYWK